MYDAPTENKGGGRQTTESKVKDNHHFSLNAPTFLFGVDAEVFTKGSQTTQNTLIQKKSYDIPDKCRGCILIFDLDQL